MVYDSVKKAFEELVGAVQEDEPVEEKATEVDETVAAEVEGEAVHDEAGEAASGETTPEAAGEDAEEPAEEIIPPEQPRVVETDHAEKGFHLDVTILPEQSVAAAEIVDKEEFLIEAVTGVDWLEDGQMEVVYDFIHMVENCRVSIRARLDRNNPEIPTISDLYPGANWHERETHDFFGIVFTGHPDLSPLLLPEDADFHPLLKDYQP